MAVAHASLDGLADDPRPWVAVLAVEALALLAYFLLFPATVTDLRYVIYPLVWINAALFAVARSSPPTASRRARLLAGGVAGAYFLALAGFTGLLALYVGGHAAHGHAHIFGWQVHMAPPGWGPRVAYVGQWFHVYFVPYRVVGYLALAYLVYVALLDFVGAALSGLLGVVTCVGCAFPLVSGALASVGGGVALSAATAFSLDISTAAFLLAVVLLSWRPS
jgi:hypothetical protein